MIFTKTKIEGVYIIDLEPRLDERGYFAKVFAQEELKKQGISYKIVNVNRSLTEKRGTIRGLHFQKAPYQEDKIVQCLQGSIFDVALDLRKSSKTYGQWFGEILSEENKKMLLIPKGCAHAFQTLEKNTVVEYFVSQYYSPQYESGIRWNDPRFNIQWPISRVKTSEKDASWELY
ncbi:MAG: dTDP-4-dehydrorhamnose 3,5-epimerase [Candidatus Levybacteria bacterium CG_4_10_14_0_2_um_filter_36_16]|nr:MAG: dTDP-4-dehydrorhamnose 3,5-epimerase [Candidatus Levybacteria bacterium CG2_30_37_29]PIR78840.1 MAG: dTDP-4-dehydrorhamnose 3,5-epimerase [Candidatus Levybacteria bacterium CG10_big_fil_rev_8_21_14_0_10_36_30]PIZ98046.1 MAG: dTDP-4-dehydrorhamnose 3,5-epimerase [Candidatus Levybacteria bacterium CG_4_10_14_0_2_um_filter_36_16]